MARHAWREPVQLDLFPTRRSMCRASLRDLAAQANEDMLFLDGPEFDAAIIGTVLVWAPPADGSGGYYHHEVALYDRAKVLEILMRDMDYDSAVEWYDYNTTGGYVGPHTPAFASLIDVEEQS